MPVYSKKLIFPILSLIVFFHSISAIASKVDDDAQVWEKYTKPEYVNWSQKQINGFHLYIDQNNLTSDDLNRYLARINPKTPDYKVYKWILDVHKEKRFYRYLDGECVEFNVESLKVGNVSLLYCLDESLKTNEHCQKLNHPDYVHLNKFADMWQPTKAVLERYNQKYSKKDNKKDNKKDDDKFEGVPKYGYISGKFAYRFSNGLRVYDPDKKEIFVLKMDGLLKRIAPANEALAKALKDNNDYQKAITNYLIPNGDMGGVAKSDMQTFIRKMDLLKSQSPLLTQFDNNPHKVPTKKEVNKVALTLINLISMLDDRKIPRITQEDSNQVEKTLKRGDIAFYTALDNNNTYAIKFGQNLVNSVTKKHPEDTANSTHVEIYVGNGKFVESTIQRSKLGVGDVRYSDIKAGRFHHSVGHEVERKIFRLKDKKMAERVADIAEKMASSSLKERTDNYSSVPSVFSIFRSSDFNKKGKRHYVRAALNGIVTEEKNVMPPTKNGPRPFFCSTLAAFILQAADGERVVKKIIDEHSTNSKPMKMPDFSATADDKKMKEFYKWSDEFVDRYKEEIDKNANFKYDYVTITPQELRSYTLNHPEYFTEVARLVPSEKIKKGSVKNIKKM
ncbi:MAG: hypothetical protein HQK51_13880 [Oligoflexia bacterium]|nr:hypothetical protein [Oligoflexia bacterium]